MGFYGNISNVNKTNMTFDKVYSNRKSMDESCALDGVYAGRYVLVEYEQFYPLDTFTIVYQVKDKFSLSYKGDIEFIGEEGVIYRCVLLTDWLTIEAEPENLLIQYYSNIFYRYENNQMINISSEQNETNYIGNFNIDREKYGTSRGYDSTVWMKQYDGLGVARYVNIAELNSVVPTFDVSVDAPSMVPVSPHFDEDSTNIYYNLHMQPQWGFRIKEASSNEKADATTEHEFIEYDENGTEITRSKNVYADIYFNSKGFNPFIRNSVTDSNYITVTPTGISGKKYNSHEKGVEPSAQYDTQELSIHLPSIGNMMSDAWDIIHGPNRDDDKIVSLQGRLNSFLSLQQGQVPVTYGKDGGELQGEYLVNIPLNKFSINSGLEGDIQNTDTLGDALNKIQNEIGNPSYEIQNNDVATIVESTGLYQYIDSHVQIVFEEIEKEADRANEYADTKDLEIYDYIKNQALYAAAATNKGSALSAVKLDKSAGSTTQPVYFNEGVPVAIDYTIETSVPANALFTDTTYNIASTIENGLMSIEDKNKLDAIDNNKLIYSDTNFSYGDGQVTIQELVNKIIELEQKIITLENYHTTTTE